MNTVYEFGLNCGYESLLIGTAVKLISSPFIPNSNDTRVLLLDRSGDFEKYRRYLGFNEVSLSKDWSFSEKKVSYLKDPIITDRNYSCFLESVKKICLNYRLYVLVDDCHMYSTRFLEDLSRSSAVVVFFCHEKFTHVLSDCAVERRYQLSMGLVEFG